LQSLFLFPGRQLLDVDFGSFGRGHALQRIDLYPVRAPKHPLPTISIHVCRAPKTQVANQTITGLQAAINLPGRQPSRRWRGKLSDLLLLTGL